MDISEENKEKVLSVIGRILNGMTLRDAINECDMSITQYYSLLSQDIQLLQLYETAQEHRSEVFADEIISIADEEPDPAVAKVRIDARKWYASKHKSKKYGDKVDINVNHTVDILGAITEAKSRVIDVTPKHAEIPQVSVSEALETRDAIDLTSVEVDK